MSRRLATTTGDSFCAERVCGLYCFEIHSHTSEHSACAGMTAAELIERALELQLDGLIVTDHHYQWEEAELQALADRRRPGALVVLSGYEVTTVDTNTAKHAGDLLIFGAPRDGTMEIWTPWEEACAVARRQGALRIAAHPFRNSMGTGDRIYQMDIDGLEVFNQNHSQNDVARAKAAVARTGLLGVAGSDAHRTVQVGQFLTVFERPIRSMEEFIAELRARRFTIRSNRPDIT